MAFRALCWDERILVHTLSLILNPQLFVNGAWSFSEVDTAREPRTQMVSHETTISVEEDGIVFRSANHPLTVKAVVFHRTVIRRVSHWTRWPALQETWKVL